MKSCKVEFSLVLLSSPIYSSGNMRISKMHIHSMSCSEHTSIQLILNLFEQKFYQTAFISTLTEKTRQTSHFQALSAQTAAWHRIIPNNYSRTTGPFHFLICSSFDRGSEISSKPASDLSDTSADHHHSMAFGVLKERLSMIYSSALNNVLLGRLIPMVSVDLFHSAQVFKRKFFLKIGTFTVFCLPGCSFSDIRASSHWQRRDKEQINYCLSWVITFLFSLFCKTMKCWQFKTGQRIRRTF